MVKEVVMPQMGYDMEKGTIVSWLKHEGDTVVEAETIVEIETDKAVFELEAPAGGSLLRIIAAEGAAVPVGKAIAHIGEPGERVPDAARPQATQPEVSSESQLSAVSASPAKSFGFPATRVSPCASPRLGVGGGRIPGARNRPSGPSHQGRPSGVPRRRGCRRRRQPSRGRGGASDAFRRECLSAKRTGRADPPAAGPGRPDPHRQNGPGYRPQNAGHVQ